MPNRARNATYVPSAFDFGEILDVGVFAEAAKTPAASRS
jgi:hypothetical protein